MPNAHSLLLQQRIKWLLAAVFGLTTLAVVAASIWVSELLQLVGQTTQNQTHEINQIEEALGKAQVALFEQTHAWKDLLLRADDGPSLARRMDRFRQYDREARLALQTSIDLLKKQSMDAAPVQDLLNRHTELLDRFEAAFKLIDPKREATFKWADSTTHRLLSPLSRQVGEIKLQVETLLSQRLSQQDLTSLEGPAGHTLKALGGLALLLPLLALGLFVAALRAIHQLNANDRRSRAIFEAIGDAVLATDDLGHITTINPTAQALLGQPAAHLLRQPLSAVMQLFDTASGAPMRSPVQRVLDDQRAVARVQGLSLQRSDGSHLAIDCSASPVLDEHGQLSGVVMVFHDVSQRQAMIGALEHERALYEQTFSRASVGMAHVSPQGLWFKVNQHLCDMLGYSADELMHKSFQGVTHPDDLQNDYVHMLAMVEGREDVYQTQKRYIHKDGRVVWADLSISLVRKPDGRPDFGITIIQNISARKQAEAQATRNRMQFETLFEQLPEGVLLINERLQVVGFNHEAQRQLGHPAEAMLQLQVSDIDANDNPDQIQARKASIEQHGRADFESRYRRADGSLMDVDVSVRLVTFDNQPPLFQVLFQDITQQRAAAAQIEHMAFHDQLTGLANRRLLHDRLAQAIHANLRRASPLAVLYIDLDHFKFVNDSLGHPVGDALLQDVARRLSQLIRAEDTVARVGGDEFVLMLNGISQREDAGAMAAKLLHELSAPILVGEEELRVTPSIGISLCPDDGRDADELLRGADAALYQAKQHGRATYRFFTQQLNDAALERLQIERLLHKAIERDEFELYYQPQIDLRDGHVVGCEALIRWNQPHLGLVPPGRFIPVAEHSALISQIGRWVMHQACQQTKRWHDAGQRLKVSFNVSARQFMHPDELIADLKSALACGVDPALIAVELTESMLMDAQRMTDVLQAVRNLGVQLSLDDFGTGYSSLSYLRRFEIEVLKIDQSFVGRSDADPDDQAMVKTIIDMARNLRMNMVAEGVETPTQVNLLQQHRCDVAQGYHFGRPMPVAQFENYLGQRARTVGAPIQPDTVEPIK